MSFDHPFASVTTSSINLEDTGSTFTVVPNDIINTHILTRLDGRTLASVGCVSTQLHSLCLNEDLWRKICQDAWPSVRDPRVRDVVSSLPFGYRSIFSNSVSSFRHSKSTSRCDRDRGSSTVPDQLISAVDMHYKGQSVFSKVQVTDTSTEGFSNGPTWVDMMKGKENADNRTDFGMAMDDLLSHVAQNVTLSWIMIDPTRKLAANLSSLHPVLVEPHFLNGHVWIRYSTIITHGDSSPSLSDTAEIRIGVTCGITKRGEVHVKDMNLVVLDKYGDNMKWKDSLVIFCEVTESGRRENWMKGRERYEEYLKKIRERRREKEIPGMNGYNIEGVICMLFFSVALLSYALWYFFSRYILRRRER